jgi:hypothetical protein
MNVKAAVDAAPFSTCLRESLLCPSVVFGMI